MAHIKPFQALRPDLDDISSPEVFFGDVKKKFPEYKKSGMFLKTKKKGFYLYQITTGENTHTGVICSLPVEEYLNGNVITHEHTLVAKEQKMLGLTLERKAMVKPILLTYPEIPSITENINGVITNREPTYTIEFEKGQEVHAFYEIHDEGQIKQLQHLFEQHVPKTYIADGHHRLATSKLMKARREKQEKDVNNYENILCALFSTSELNIHDYNRIVDCNTISPMMLMVKLAQKFNISPLKTPRKPERKHEIVLASGDEWFSLQWKEEILAKYTTDMGLLDVNLLNIEVLEQIFEIEDVAQDSRVTYVDGPSGVKGVSKKICDKPSCFAFILPPVSWNEFIDITSNGVMLPPKSTWFEPRIKNGLIVYPY